MGQTQRATGAGASRDAATPFLTAPERAAGVPHRLLDSSGLHRPTRGVRVLSEPASVAERAACLSLVLPAGTAFSHLTALRLHGLPTSYAMEEDDRLHVLRPLDSRRMRRPGVVAHRAVHRRAFTVVDGLTVVDLADTWADLGELVGRGKPIGLDDLIVVGDAITLRLGSSRRLESAVMARVRPRGKVTLLEALQEIRFGSASPRETLARLMLVRCGLPEPRLNAPVCDDRDRLLGVADLLWEGQERSLAGEYQGEEFHDAPEQRAADALRRQRFDRCAGVAVEEIWKADMATSVARRACVLRFAEALGVPRSEVDLSQADPRFFSRHAIDLSIQRHVMRAARGRR